MFGGEVNVSRSYAVNGLNQYTGAGAATFTYDANGNLTGDGTNSYSYDVENRLIGQSSSAGSATLLYDPLGRLFETSSALSGTTRFHYDGDELIGEYDGAHQLLRRYVHGAGVDDPLLWYEGTGTGDKRSLQSDHQGSITGIANTNGTLRTINAYDPFGIPSGLANASTPNSGRFGYTGQAWIPEVGLYYYKARFYSPFLNRFM